MLSRPGYQMNEKRLEEKMDVRLRGNTCIMIGLKISNAYIMYGGQICNSFHQNEGLTQEASTGMNAQRFSGGFLIACIIYVAQEKWQEIAGQ